MIYDTWSHGNIDVGNIDHGSIRYVLDYINKDPIFADSKYELYGDFEPPFYHFSKGLGFTEIERLVNDGFFNSLGQGFWTDKHKYTLPPYLKDKFGFGSSIEFYTDSQKRWKDEKGFDNIDLAVQNRNDVVETVLEHSQVSRGKHLLNMPKFERNEMFDRFNRFNGFTDYDSVDKLLNFS